MEDINNYYLIIIFTLFSLSPILSLKKVFEGSWAWKAGLPKEDVWDLLILPHIANFLVARLISSVSAYWLMMSLLYGLGIDRLIVSLVLFLLDSIAWRLFIYLRVKEYSHEFWKIITFNVIEAVFFAICAATISLLD
ncbi:MAG: hypothetical protein ACOX6V_05410 [Patescibacteria group bacterium]|jgi:hypothetical protein